MSGGLSEKGGLRIDLDKPANPQQVGGFDAGEQVQSVAVSGDYAYLSGNWQAGGAWKRGLQVFQLGTPANPQRVGGYDTVFDQAVGVSGAYAYLANPTGLQLIDVGNPAQPQEVAGYETQGWAYGSGLALAKRCETLAFHR